MLYDPGCAPTYKLTKRQTEMLQYVAYGLSTKEIATACQRSPQTVKNHLSRIRKCLGARTTAQAVYRAVQLGILPLQEKQDAVEKQD